MSAKTRKSRIKIDGYRLKHLIMDKDLSLNEASRKIGHQNTYLSHACIANEIGKPEIMLIEQILDIRYSDYKWKEKEVEEKKPQPSAQQLIDLDGEYKAIYDVVQKAIEDYLVRHLEVETYRAVKKALDEVLNG